MEQLTWIEAIELAAIHTLFILVLGKSYQSDQQLVLANQMKKEDSSQNILFEADLREPLVTNIICSR